MSISVIVLALTFVIQVDTVSRECERDGVEILKAAQEWALTTLQRDPAFDPSRAYVDLNSGSSLQPRTAGMQARAAVARALAAAEVGFSAKDRADDAGWRACIENRSEECRQAGGTTIIQIPTVRMVSSDEAVVYLTLRTLTGRTRAEGRLSGARTVQLFLGRVNGSWTVVGEGVKAVD